MKSMPFAATLNQLEAAYDRMTGRVGSARALTAGVETGAEKLAITTRALADLSRVGSVRGGASSLRGLPGRVSGSMRTLPLGAKAGGRRL